jgi:hypothetical protein
MFVARWSIEVRFGHQEDAFRVIDSWWTEVAGRVGWDRKMARRLAGTVGPSQSRFEIEVMIPNLVTLEKVWEQFKDLRGQKEFSQNLEPYIVSGSNRWEVFQVLE